MVFRKTNSKSEWVLGVPENPGFSSVNPWMLVQQSHHIVWNNFGEITESNCPTITAIFQKYQCTAAAFLSGTSGHCQSPDMGSIPIMSTLMFSQAFCNSSRRISSDSTTDLLYFPSDVCRDLCRDVATGRRWMVAAFIQSVLIILTWGSGIKLLKGEPQRTAQCREQFV